MIKGLFEFTVFIANAHEYVAAPVGTPIIFNQLIIRKEQAQDLFLVKFFQGMDSIL